VDHDCLSAYCETEDAQCVVRYNMEEFYVLVFKITAPKFSQSVKVSPLITTQFGKQG